MSDSGEPPQAEPVCSFFRKPTKNKNIRKRSVGDDDDGDENAHSSESLPIHKQKKAPKSDNKLHFSSVGSSKKSQTEESTSEHDTVFHFESSKEIQVHHDSRATATLETETEFDRDARAIRERTLKQAKESLKGNLKTDEKVYKGIHGYTDYKAGFRREHTVSGEKAGGAHGPLRASAHIRVSARFDYQPDICKDYKETGYCGFGDACKFMHDRGDYKSGWQLEKEWEEAEKARKRKLALGRDDSDGEGRDGSEEEDDDSLPFRCFICRTHFKEVKNPVVTQCKHYFCDKCALEHHSRNKKCYICNKPTLGIFNIAHEIKKKSADSK
ncbi:zinc finger CCCH domain-containing protein 1 [Aristolochia californica]|uniref:zinc finger CCCH domain-containing protein 1 n=1 Tax=Aristolochia californica TaxID=171875 RepID=UPI0035DC7DE2